MYMERRDLLRFAGLGIAWSVLPSPCFAAKPLKPLKVRRAKVAAGVECPFRILHVSDSHVARIDSRSPEETYAFAKARSRNGRELGEYYLDSEGTSPKAIRRTRKRVRDRCARVSPQR